MLQFFTPPGPTGYPPAFMRGASFGPPWNQSAKLKFALIWQMGRELLLSRQLPRFYSVTVMAALSRISCIALVVRTLRITAALNSGV